MSAVAFSRSPLMIMIQHTEMDKLVRFHALHFPNQVTPDLVNTPREATAEADRKQNPPSDTDDGLGYYEDGVKRTLTDEQVKMFRHSEIQRLLSGRRAAKEKENRQKRRQEHGSDTHAPPKERKRRFQDDPDAGRADINTLTYDDPPHQEVKGKPIAEKFIWPTLPRA
ncbi:uncharacterized protein Z518_09493 [Rhinocladiella mackenziei CBS 650.93]|uniref:Uncharacterized protein n=1 Tax=Rhinocladiella mackenziei CBS 650.93 TaxID=1442369 RepID=A0A0D2IES7_9EURO|nr:uncharacterized protein Z518_09493 [Rhinocladiella mackenziei CBS 650.93]KIX01766.1 hypothetical protein Z518_09493 [Rhinocladiella mackenziei CBS 650.93]